MFEEIQAAGYMLMLSECRLSGNVMSAGGTRRLDDLHPPSIPWVT